MANIKPKRLLTSQPTFVRIDPKVEVIKEEKQYDEDGNLVAIQQTIVRDYAVDRHLKVADFRLGSILDAGAVKLLKPISLGAPSDALLAFEDVASRLSEDDN